MTSAQAQNTVLLLAGGGVGHVGPNALAQPWVAAVVGCACLVALALAFAGAFLPFAGLACGFGCPPTPTPPPGSFSGAMVASTDGRIVVALLLSLMPVVLLSFDSLNAAVSDKFIGSTGAGY